MVSFQLPLDLNDWLGKSTTQQCNVMKRGVCDERSWSHPSAAFRWSTIPKSNYATTGCTLRPLTLPIHPCPHTHLHPHLLRVHSSLAQLVLAPLERLAHLHHHLSLVVRKQRQALNHSVPAAAGAGEEEGGEGVTVEKNGGNGGDLIPRVGRSTIPSQRLQGSGVGGRGGGRIEH